MTTMQDCSIGLGKESTYGTGVTPTKFPEFLDEKLVWNPTFVQGAGMRVGSRVARAARRGIGKQSAGGDINVEVATKGMGVFFEALFGAVTSTAVPGQSGVFQHVFTPATTEPLPSYTIQKGIPTVGGGATTPMTFNGSVCKSGELSAGNGEIVKLKTSWDSREVKTDVAYAAPAYPTGLELLTFVHGSIRVGGAVTPPTATALAAGGTVAANISDFSVSWDNKIDDKGNTFGNRGKRGRRPVTEGLAELKGKITAEYTDTVLRDAYLTQQQLAIVLTFQTDTIIGTSAKPTLEITIPVVALEGEVPSASGSLVEQSIDFTGLDGLGGSPIYVAIVSTDTAV